VRGVEKHRQEQIDRLLSDLDFPALYRGYAWKNDTWEKGFPDIFSLEQEVTAAARDQTLGLEHVQKIACWGGIPNRDRIDCADRLSIALYFGDSSGVLADARAREYHRDRRGADPGIRADLCE